MKQITILLVLLLTVFFDSLTAQNLCPNPGFEQLSGCPSGAGEINLAMPWTDAGSPADLFSFCHVNGPVPGCNDVSVPANYCGNTPAHNGSCYAGFFTKKNTADQRTYVQAPLTSPLAAGQLYCISAYFKRASFSKFATNRIGVVLATAPLAQPGSGFIPVNPHAEVSIVVADTLTWTSFSAYYTGTGLEDQVIFGNFRSDGNTSSYNFTVAAPACSTLVNAAYYYIDDVSVTPVNEQLSVSGDTLICAGETTLLTGISNTHGYWSLQSNPTDTLAAPNNILTVNPAVNTTYLWHGIQSVISITVSIGSPPQVSLPGDTTVCDGEVVELNATNTSATYLWSTGETTPYLAAGDSGTYIVTVNNGYCFARDTFQLGIISSPITELGNDRAICTENGESVVLDAGPGTSWFWMPGGDTTRSLTVTVPGTYQVVVTHGTGCTRTDSLTVVEFCRETLYVPGAFTPNNDGKNDFFFADGTNVENYKIMIFNRWGQPVYNTSSLGTAGAWDGKQNQKPVPEGLYTYQISYDVLQSNGKKKPEKKSGYVVLYR